MEKHTLFELQTIVKKMITESIDDGEPKLTFFPETKPQKDACYIFLNFGLRDGHIKAADHEHNDLDITSTKLTPNKFTQFQYNPNIAYFYPLDDKGIEILSQCSKMPKN